MSWLKKVVIAQNKPPEDSIISVLKSNMSGYRPGRDRSVLHASDVTKPNFCPRKWALMDIEGTKSSPEYANTATRATWDIGSMTARVLIENWAGEHVVGNWMCRRCHQQRTMCSKPKGMCSIGGKHDWAYEEVVFVSKEYGISGSIDALFDVGKPKLVVTELKIMAPEEFATLLAPLPEHRIRTSLYLKLIADSGTPYLDRFNLHEARVLYVSRGYGKKNEKFGEVLPFKEFSVHRDDGGLLDLLAKVQSLKKFREIGVVPCGICNTALDKPAQTCKLCKTCFSGDYPPNHQLVKLEVE
jgi:hypothetical protein